MAPETWILIRRVRLSSGLKPVDVYGPDAVPLPIDWLSIVHYSNAENPFRERYLLVLSDDLEVVHDWFQYETLPIAFDQAHSIFGVAEDEWETVDQGETFPITSWLSEAHGDHGSDRARPD